MPRSKKDDVRCPQCGRPHPAAVDGCPACGARKVAPTEQTPELDGWSRTSDRLKTQWVAAVGAFWVSTAVLVAVFFLQDRVSLVLVSICLGLMILGIGLKIRYQLHLRKDPGGS